LSIDHVSSRTLIGSLWMLRFTNVRTIVIENVGGCDFPAVLRWCLSEFCGHYTWAIFSLNALWPLGGAMGPWPQRAPARKTKNQNVNIETWKYQNYVKFGS
jgi:hypothetical protein